ncbi:MAG TPA: hypothetical protein VEH52_13135 [Gaiellaceae bacterium]|nr:hypothetical protein [Gaiellaceae bacterium]
MNQEAWPTPRRPSSEPLPQLDDLPIADQGYEQESVKAAFDSFYRHAAQLDAALRTLEAVDSFNRQATALRADLRSLRSAGWTQQPWTATPAYGFGARSAREGVSPAVWRILGEAAFLIAVAVALGVAKVSWWVIVVVMALAWLIVGLIEWAASRERWSAPRASPAPAHPIVDAESPARPVADDAHGWTAFEQAQEPSDAMTMIGSAAESPQADESSVEEPAAASPATPDGLSVADDEPAEPEPLPEAEPEPEPEPELPPAADASRRHWWSRPDTDEDVEEAPEPETPRHVRVLPPDEQRAAVPLDPWEQAFDEADAGGDGNADEEDTGEQPALAADVEQSARRRFRRR